MTTGYLIRKPMVCSSHFLMVIKKNCYPLYCESYFKENFINQTLISLILIKPTEHFRFLYYTIFHLLFTVERDEAINHKRVQRSLLSQISWLHVALVSSPWWRSPGVCAPPLSSRYAASVALSTKPALSEPPSNKTAQDLIFG